MGRAETADPVIGLVNAGARPAAPFDGRLLEGRHRAQNVATFGNAPDVCAIRTAKIHKSAGFNRGDYVSALTLRAALGIHFGDVEPAIAEPKAMLEKSCV
jgi:hypothetical protein